MKKNLRGFCLLPVDRPALVLWAGILSVFILSMSAAQAQTRPFKMREQESEHLRLLYLDLYNDNILPQITSSYYNALDFQKDTFNWEPWEKSTVLLMDISDYGNGGAFSSPSNGIHLEIAPVSRTFEAFTASERFFSLINHELVHVATLDVANKQDAFWRKVFFGKPMPDSKHPETILFNYLTTPRVAAPRWYHEGSAVFFETWMAAGRGRAEGAYDEMVFRAMVRDDAHFFGPLGLVSKGTQSDFRGMANAYLYGTRFFSYLTFAYTPEQVVEWLSRSEDSKAYYASQFKHVFGRSLNDVWTDWIAFEKSFQAENLATIRSQPITQAERLSPRALGSISRAFYVPERHSLIAAFRFPGVVEHLGELDIASGKIGRHHDIKGSMPHRVSSIAYDPVSDTAWFTTDNYAYRDIVQLNLQTGKKKVLMRNERIGDIVFNQADKSLWGVRHRNGQTAIIRMAAPYEEFELIHDSALAEDIFDLDISADGEMLAYTIGDITGAQRLKVHRIDDILSQNFDNPIVDFTFEDSRGKAIAQPEGAAFSPDGEYIYFSAYPSGASNIFRIALSSGEVEAISNAETGYVRPIPLADGSVIAFEYTGDGFVPVRLDGEPIEIRNAINFFGSTVARKHGLREKWSVISTKSEVDLDAVAPVEGDYRPRQQLRLGSIHPIVEGFKDSTALGLHVNIEDPAFFNEIDLTLSYSLDGDFGGGQKLHADVRYRGLYWRARYWHNDADFYDLFGPTERARKGDAFIVGYRKSLIYDDPRQLSIDAEIGFYTGLDTLPMNQNVASGFDQIAGGKIELAYTNTEESLGSVDHEKGWRWNITSEVDKAGGDLIGRFHGGIDFGFALPVKNSSIWFYNAGGFSSGNEFNPLASYYFGGFKNNYVDDREVKRYRDYHSFPGFEIDEVAAQNFIKSVGEWNLPPLRFESVGTPGLYLGHLRPAVFGGVLLADPGGAADRTVYTLGGQVDLNFTIAHRLPMVLSVGYASGFAGAGDRSDEFMISLKIM